MCYCCCCPPRAHTAVETKNHHKSFFSWGIMCVRTATKPMGWRIGMATHSLILLHSFLLHGDCKNASILSATLLLLPVIAILFSKTVFVAKYTALNLKVNIAEMYELNRGWLSFVEVLSSILKPRHIFLQKFRSKSVWS